MLPYLVVLGRSGRAVTKSVTVLSGDENSWMTYYLGEVLPPGPGVLGDH